MSFSLSIETTTVPPPLISTFHLFLIIFSVNRNQHTATTLNLDSTFFSSFSRCMKTSTVPPPSLLYLAVVHLSTHTSCTSFSASFITFPPHPAPASPFYSSFLFSFSSCFMLAAHTPAMHYRLRCDYYTTCHHPRHPISHGVPIRPG